MKLTHKKIDFEADREYILECHFKIDYACGMDWQQAREYEAYRKECLDNPKMTAWFTDTLKPTVLSDVRNVAEIVANESDENIGYLWLNFIDSDYKVYAYICEIFVDERFRKQGVGSYLYRYAEQKARECGAIAIRASTNADNLSSVKLNEKMGFAKYSNWYEFEKLFKY